MIVVNSTAIRAARIRLDVEGASPGYLLPSYVIAIQILKEYSLDIYTRYLFLNHTEGAI